MFKYEASHPWPPRTSPSLRRPAAGRLRRPAVPTEPCSIAGVRPAHGEVGGRRRRLQGHRLAPVLVRRADAHLRRRGGLHLRHGATFQAGKCNVREAFRAEGSETSSEAPTGHFTDCESPSGAFDVNGNLWEWVSDRDEADSRARQYQGAGWRTIAQRHQDANQACATETLLRGFSAPSFATVTWASVLPLGPVRIHAVRIRPVMIPRRSAPC
ncbi:MAG: SUMF1/EgtB/PvdO family nonheme iron enzyme [bacterium]